MKRKSRDFYRVQGERILLSGESSHIVHTVTSCSSPLAQAFLQLMLCDGLQPTEVDEEAFMAAADPLDYLSRTQHMRVYRFELSEDWQSNLRRSFLWYDAEGNIQVIQNKGSKYRIIYPDGRKPKLLSGKECRAMTGKAMTLRPVIPSGGIQPKKMFATEIRLLRGDGIVYLFFALLAALTSAAIPIGTNIIVSQAIPNGREESMLPLFLCVLAVILAGFMNSQIASQLRIKIQFRYQSDLFLKVCDHLLKLPSGKLNENMYQLPSKMMLSLNAMGSVIAGIMSIALTVIELIVACVQMKTYSQGAEKIATFLFILYAVILVFLSVLEYRSIRQGYLTTNVLSAQRTEMLDGIENIRNSGDEELFYYRSALDFEPNARNKLTKQTQSGRIQALTTVMSSVLMLGIFTQVVMNGKGNVTLLASYMSALSLAIGYFSSLFTEVVELISNIPILQYAREVITLPSDTDDRAEDAGEISGAIHLSHVTFRYPGMSRDVIHDLSLDVRPGEHIGICGSSGCGKSTLLRLMLGFEKATSGAINYDDYDIAVCNPKQIRRQFGVVLQDAMLLTGSIKRNIGLSEHPDMDMVREAAKNAAILDDIEQMPMKFETIVSSESTTVSGGQKQRIVIARALMKHPRILFFDEATSALDNQAQKSVQESIDQLNTTCIMVAHRLSTIQNCDRILYLENGSIAEQGTFDELMKLDGKFARMARRNIL